MAIIDSKFSRRNFLGTATASLACLLLPTFLVDEAEARPRKQRQHGQGYQLSNVTQNGNLVVYFPTNSWTLDMHDLRDIASFARKYKGETSWIIEGYCDQRGSIEANIQLGQNRANGVEEYLRGSNARGLVQSVSYGESKSLAHGEKKEEYAKDRRLLLSLGRQRLKEH